MDQQTGPESCPVTNLTDKYKSGDAMESSKLVILGKKGFGRMDRELMDWTSVWSKPDTLCVYIHCVMNAAYHETEYQGMILKPGQFVTSAAKMATECGLSEVTVKRVFKRLESFHLIARQAIGKGTKSGTLITVANSAFQGDPNFNPDLQKSFDLADKHSAFVPLTEPEAAYYQRIRKEKEEKKEKEEEIEKNVGGSGGNNGAFSQEPPPPKKPLYVNLQDCMNEIRSQYGDEVADETWQRVLDNSPPGDKSRMTVAYLRSVARSVADRIKKEKQKEAIRKAGKPEYDDEGREILYDDQDREIWDEY